MAHLRQTLRERVATVLTGLASGATVYQSRVDPVEAQTLPVFLVYTLEDEVDLDSGVLGNHTFFRNLTVAVDAIARQASGMDDALDTLCAEAEAAITADSDSASAGTLGALTEWCELESTSITLEDGAERDTGRAAMRWAMQYRVDTTDPTSRVA